MRWRWGVRAGRTALLAWVVAGCGGDARERDATTGEALPARPGAARPPQAHVEGQYALTAVDGQPPPAVLEREGACRIELVEAAIRLAAGRFAFQNRVREVCDGRPGEPVVHSAGGTYMVHEGGHLMLEADLGTAFRTASATADSLRITITELAADEATQRVSWTFERRDGQLVPLPGTTEPDGD